MTSAIQVQCSTNWAVKPPGSWPVLGVHKWWRCKWIIWNILMWLVYIWTAEKLYEDMTDCRSYNYYTQLKQYWKLNMKKFRLEQGIMTLVTLVQCSTNWVRKPAGELDRFGGSELVKIQVNIWILCILDCREIYQDMNDYHSYIENIMRSC